MNRFDVTTVDKLNVGDRFYRANDARKEVLELVSMPARRTYFRTYRFFFVTAKAMEQIRHNQEHIYRLAKPINPTTQVVYLRSSENVTP